jgi:nucleotide-binding universal stress UspA family protein
MKLLIAHDGTNRIDETLDDLRRAGLPRDAMARALSAVQIMAPTPETMIGINQTFTPLESGVEETVKQSCRRLREIFPEWEIQGIAAIGPLTLEVLDQADEWKPDLIVVGGDGHSLLERLFSGNVSLILVQQAPCSVRVARSRPEGGDPHPRLLIGVDGSEYAEAAAREVAARNWPAGAEVRLVTAIGPFFNLPTNLLESEFERARLIQQSIADTLRGAGLDVSQVVKEEDAAKMILREAESWRADCVFVGQRGLGFMKRMLFGSVSSTVAAQAPCSVEVVRVDEVALNAEELRRQNIEVADQIMRSMTPAA